MQNNSAREIDKNGFMIVRGCPLSREGIYEYSAQQIGLGGDPHRIVNVYRPAEEVADPDSINSLKSLPLIDDHEMLSGIDGKYNFSAPEDVGVEGILTDNVWFDENDGWLKGDVKIFSREMLNKIKDKKDDLSLGFNCIFYPENGTWNGKKYEVIQRKIRGNHLAVVDDGRVEGAKILDAMCFDSLNFNLLTNGDLTMPKKLKANVTDSALDQLRDMIPALEKVVSECKNELKGEADTESEEKLAETPNNISLTEGDEELELDDESLDDESLENKKPEDIVVLIHQIEALLSQIKDIETPCDPEMDEYLEESPEISGDEEEDFKKEEEIEDIAEPSIKGITNIPKPSIEGIKEKEKEVGDKAIKKFYSDLRMKERLYNRASRIIGAFQCSAMDAKDVALYSAKKLGIKCAKDEAISAVNLYLDGIAKGQQRVAVKREKIRSVMDSKTECKDFDNWLKEVK